jgi:hypothetical protein
MKSPSVSGIGKALGGLGVHFDGQLVLWQAVAGVLEQGSRLSAVCWARGARVLRGARHRARLGRERCLQQSRLAQRALEARRESLVCGPGEASSYLEGEKNAFGAYGNDRDARRAKTVGYRPVVRRARGSPFRPKV